MGKISTLKQVEQPRGLERKSNRRRNRRIARRFDLASRKSQKAGEVQWHYEKKAPKYKELAGEVLLHDFFIEFSGNGIANARGTVYFPYSPEGWDYVFALKEALLDSMQKAETVIGWNTITFYSKDGKKRYVVPYNCGKVFHLAAYLIDTKRNIVFSTPYHVEPCYDSGFNFFFS